jgi:uncharacterized protein YbjT (DUF2867 family)
MTQALRDAGHRVIRAVRHPGESNDIAVNFREDTTKSTWLSRLKEIEVVINAVGVLRNHPDNPMLKLHKETPVALFSACAEAGVKHIVHLSALGVDSGVDVPYFTTRLAAERALRDLPSVVRWLCLRPSVIYGKDGASAQMFQLLAKLPVHVLPMGGKQTLQPVHIDDICEAVMNWLANPDASSQTVEVVGAEATTMRGMLDSYREQSGYRPALHVAMPELFVRIAALAGNLIPSSPLCTDTYTMLAAGNAAPSQRFSALLGHQPRNYREFIS